MSQSPKSKSPKSKSPKKNDKKKSPTKGKKDEEDHGVENLEDDIVICVPTGVMRRRMRFLLETQLKTDIEFLVGSPDVQISIKAHKCMLSAESPIFENLFVKVDEWKLQQEKKKLEEELNKDVIDPKPQLDQQKNSPKSKQSKKGSKENSPTRSPKKKSERSNSKSSPKKKGSKVNDSNTIKPLESLNNVYIDQVIGEDKILVQDVHPSGFHQLLSYIYYDQMAFTSVVGTLHTLYAARKYCFNDLSRLCVNYLENNVCIEHVLKLLQASLDFHEEHLKVLCLRLIINDTFEVVKRKEFKDISKDLLNIILQQDILNIREIELFDQVMHWAENKCELVGIKVTAQNQRIAIGPEHFSLIRFPTILAHEFATHIVDSGVLRSSEVISILQYYITGRKLDLVYSCRIRRRPCLDLMSLDNVSVSFSDQTDITFIVRSDVIKRANSFKDIYIPADEILPHKTLLIQQRQHTGSPPPRFNVNGDEFDQIEANIRHLAQLHDEKMHFEYGLEHLAIIRSHYN